MGNKGDRLKSKAKKRKFKGNQFTAIKTTCVTSNDNDGPPLSGNIEAISNNSNGSCTTSSASSQHQQPEQDVVVENVLPQSANLTDNPQSASKKKLSESFKQLNSSDICEEKNFNFIMEFNKTQDERVDRFDWVLSGVCM